MATNYKVLGQVAPSATSETTLYTAPASTEAVISTLVIANRSATLSGSFRVAVRPGGEALADKHYIAYDLGVGPADSTNLTIGITLAAGDVISVYASNENLTFSAFGTEIA